MTIRRKILSYLLTVTLLITSVSFVVIYLLFVENREEEFQQQQKDKILYTIKLLAEYREMSERIANIMDELTIHDFYDEKMLVFDANKDIVFSSIDDLLIPDYKDLLGYVSPSVPWYETRQGKYDIVVLHHVHLGKSYYAISKAYDEYGHTSLVFLRNILIITFLLIVLCMIWVAGFVANRIVKPINLLANRIHNVDLNKEEQIYPGFFSTSEEINALAERFNDLLSRTYQAINFRKHTIHHVSHQLKTPIAILVNELEKLQAEQDLNQIKKTVVKLIEKTKSLGAIIQSLLELSKFDSGQHVSTTQVRVDEMIFDIEQEIKIMNPQAEVSVVYLPTQAMESKLTLNVNELLLKQALHNILSNSIVYSSNNKAMVEINTTQPGFLVLSFSNTGPTIDEDERKFMFTQFFRGKNSRGISGFGIGLVLTHRILQIFDARICYKAPKPLINIIEITFKM